VDRQTLVLFIPIIALSIPVIALVLSGLRKYWQMRIEEARSRAGSLGSGAEVELEQMRSELDQVRRELGEVQERLDFTERLLARTDRERLGSPPSSQA
jgi:chromosome segregation ATPase